LHYVEECHPRPFSPSADAFTLNALNRFPVVIWFFAEEQQVKPYFCFLTGLDSFLHSSSISCAKV